MASIVLPPGWKAGGRSGGADVFHLCFTRADEMQLVHDIRKAMATGDPAHWIGVYSSEMEPSMFVEIEAPRAERAMAVLNERYPLPEWLTPAPGSPPL